MEKKQQPWPSARDVLTNFMEQRAMRKTPERYEVLRVVETMEGIFTIDQLMTAMKEKAAFSVSRATLFNSMELFCSAGLLIKHPLQTAAHYELRTDAAPKAYAICRQCSSITRVSIGSARLALQNTRVRYFNAEDLLLYMHGICRKCQSMRRQEERERKKRHEKKASQKQNKTRNGKR